MNTEWLETLPTDYVHHLAGRLRIRVKEVKRAPEAAQRLEDQLGRVDGITCVRANPITGNVLVLYDDQKLRQERVINAIRELGFLTSPSRLNDRSTPRRNLRMASNGGLFAPDQFAQHLMKDLAVSACAAVLKFGMPRNGRCRVIALECG